VREREKREKSKLILIQLKERNFEQVEKENQSINEPREKRVDV